MWAACARGRDDGPCVAIVCRRIHGADAGTRLLCLDCYAGSSCTAVPTRLLCRVIVSQEHGNSIRNNTLVCRCDTGTIYIYREYVCERVICDGLLLSSTHGSNHKCATRVHQGCGLRHSFVYLSNANPHMYSPTSLANPFPRRMCPCTNQGIDATVTVIVAVIAQRNATIVRVPHILPTVPTVSTVRVRLYYYYMIP